jgi:ferredoxin-NADP reductase
MRFVNEWSEARIEEITQVGETVKSFTLKLPRTVKFAAGAHIDVEVFIYGQPQIRSYSLVGKKGDFVQIAVKLLNPSRGGSAYMWTLEVGQKLKVSQPKNHFGLDYGNHKYILIAGGIGITPMLLMAEELIERAADFTFLYAAKHRADMPFLTELQNLLGDKLKTYVSDKKETIDISDLVNKVEKGTQLYICGPLRMLESTRKAWLQADLPLHDLRYETFGTTGLYPTDKFIVHLPRFKKTIEVKATESLLDALEKEHIDVMSDCKRGECGLCQVEVIEHSGIIDHRDAFFSQKEKESGNKLCACVSRVYEGEITIDTSFRG